MSHQSHSAGSRVATTTAPPALRTVLGPDLTCVVKSSRTAFPEAPNGSPFNSRVRRSLLRMIRKRRIGASTALEGAARSPGSVVIGAGGAVSIRVFGAPNSAMRVFRRADLEGDGVPDGAQALEGAKNVVG